MSALGVEASKWNVTYSTSTICGLMGSKVTMSCSYTYPIDTVFKKAFWTTVNDTRYGEPRDLSEASYFHGRAQVDNSSDKCTLILSDVSKPDAIDYYCRVVTNNGDQKWLQKPGVKLTVTGKNTTFYELLSPHGN